PYPPLLNPKKLNDKNEKINYYNLSAELAWQMNLPLPDNYEFVLAYKLSSGTGMLGRLCNEVLDRPIVGFWIFGAYENYKHTYSFYHKIIIKHVQ
ncbi:sugar transferase, partial [Campylobacter jejuni]